MRKHTMVVVLLYVQGRTAQSYDPIYILFMWKKRGHYRRQTLTLLKNLDSLPYERPSALHDFLLKVPIESSFDEVTVG